MSGSIHIKLEGSEANNLKKNTLFLEKELLESVKHLREYGALRKKEFIIKNQIKKDVNSIITLISEVEATLPKEEAKEAIKKETPHKEIENTKKIENLNKKAFREKRKSNIEEEIDEIRRKLSMLD